MKVLSIVIAFAACKGKRAAHDDAPPPSPPPRDAAADAPSAWPELADLPQIDAVHTVALPIDRQKPRGDVGGPVVANGVAVVSSSQLGFVAVDYARGQVAWKKPAGARVAPPLAVADGFLLISDCERAEPAALGCLRVVSPTGSDRSYVVIRGHALPEAGDQAVWARDADRVVWRRGNQAVLVDVTTGSAQPYPAADPPLVVQHKHETWEITRDAAGQIVGAEHGHIWHTERAYAALIGAIYLPEQSPMIRAVNNGHFGGAPELLVFDIDATGSLHGQVARPVPGVALTAHAIDAVGDTALAVHLDASLERDFIAGYAANALLMWVYPLPRRPRVDATGVAVAPDAVVVFHDGDTLAILPELSAPPTAPGAARPPSENPTP